MNFTEMMKLLGARLGFRLNRVQLLQLERYYENLIAWNKKINLTAITEPDQVAVKHFLDCMMIFRYADIPEQARVIDIGTGAGFPGVVMKICRPDLELTLLDSLNKRLIFLCELKKELLIDYTLESMRAEDGGKNPEYREKYDIVVSRAVAQLDMLNELCLPYARVGGAFYAFKGPKGREEAQTCAKGAKRLGGEIGTINEYMLGEDYERMIIRIDKVSPTPDAYPRAYAKIKSKPLR